MKCLILAAGKSSRLQLRGNSKPLIPVLGKPLIERVISSALKAEADDFYVVTGYRGELIAAFLKEIAEKLDVTITTINNDDWEKENGISVLKARDYIDEPFLLLMADHIFDPSAMRKLIEQSVSDGETLLCVDRDLNNPNIDLEDVTRVKVLDDKIIAIGKGLEDFNCFDTGIFLCTPEIFKAIEMSADKENDTTLSGGIRILAAEKKVGVVDITGLSWIDVDIPEAIKTAENIILQDLRE